MVRKKGGNKGEAWKRKKQEKKIAFNCIKFTNQRSIDTTEKWLTLFQTHNSKRNQNEQAFGRRFQKFEYDITFLNNSQTIYYMVYLY